MLKLSITVFLTIIGIKSFSQTENHIRKKAEIQGSISPKSIVSSGNGLFAAQNMMYRHTITIYDKTGLQLKKLNDEVQLSQYGIDTYGSGKFKGAPVEGVFTNNGNYLWISNYNMSGEGFSNEGCDHCIGTEYDPSFLYKINTSTFEIENVIKVGSVPKFIAVNDDESLLIVSNWVSSDISIIDLSTEKEIKRVTVGAHPRGVDITKNNSFAYVTIMGSTKIAEVNLSTYEVTYILGVGKAPRSLILADNDSTLYVSLNSNQSILKYNRFTENKVSVKTPSGPRSMTLTPQEDYLYVVNYFDNTFCKISTDSMKVEAIVTTNAKPIGICGNWDDSEIWVACYSGTIEIFKDFELDRKQHPSSWLGIDFNSFDFDAISYSPAPSAAKDSPMIDLTSLEASLEPIEPSISVPLSSKKENVLISTKTIEATPLPLKKRNSSLNCSYYIIVGAFSIPENASKKQKQLIEQGFPSTLINGNKLTYVSANCASSEEEAEAKKIIVRTTLEGASSAWILKSK